MSLSGSRFRTSLPSLCRWSLLVSLSCFPFSFGIGEDGKGRFDRAELSLPATLPVEKDNIFHLQKFLEDAGVAFGESSLLSFSKNSSSVVVENSPEQLLLIEAIFGFYPVGPDSGKREAEAAVLRTEERLKNTKIETVKFTEMTISEALQELSQASAVDGNEPLKISIQNVDPKRTQKLNLHLTQVSLEEALRRTVQLAQLHYQVEPREIVVTTLIGEVPEFGTTAFRIPPSFAELLNNFTREFQSSANDPFAELSSALEKNTLKKQFQLAGIGFPSGSRILIIESLGLLVSRNRPSENDLLGVLVGVLADEGNPEWQASRKKHWDDRIDTLLLSFSEKETISLAELSSRIRTLSRKTDDHPDLWSREIPIHAEHDYAVSEDPPSNLVTPEVTLFGTGTIREHLEEACRQSGFVCEVLAGRVRLARAKIENP